MLTLIVSPTQKKLDFAADVVLVGNDESHVLSIRGYSFSRVLILDIPRSQMNPELLAAIDKTLASTRGAVSYFL